MSSSRNAIAALSPLRTFTPFSVRSHGKRTSSSASSAKRRGVPTDTEIGQDRRIPLNRKPRMPGRLIASIARMGSKTRDKIFNIDIAGVGEHYHLGVSDAREVQ